MKKKIMIFTILLFSFFLFFKVVFAFNLNSFFSSILDFLFPSSPEIISAKVEPIKVEPSDWMEIIVEARDKYGIDSVKADMAGIEKIELKLIYGDEKNGVWKATWFVHDVEVGKSYNATIIVTNEKGKVSIANVEFHDDPVFCCRRMVNITGASPWAYRKPIIINNTANSNTLTDYQVLVNLDATDLLSSSKVAKDYRDIRFTDSDENTLLNYWIEIPFVYNGTAQRINTTANIKSVTYLLNTTGTTGVGNLTFALKNDTVAAAGRYINLTVNNILIATITIPSSPTSYTYSLTNLVDTNNITFWTSDTVNSASITSVSINYYNKTQRIWVKVPFIPASSTKTIYVYYGNPSATSQSNGTATFDFFDDFNDGNISDWSMGGEGDNPTSGKISVQSDYYISPPYSMQTLAADEYNYAWGYTTTWAYKSISLSSGSYKIDFYNRLYGYLIGNTTGDFAAVIYIDSTEIYGRTTSRSGRGSVTLEWLEDSANLTTSSSPITLKLASYATVSCWTEVWWDDVRIRKYTSPEPTTSVGSEEIAIANVTLDTASLISAGKMRSDCGDIRFTDSRSFDSALWTRNFNYNITNCNSASTQFLVNVTALSPTIGTTFYVYYGNPAVTSISKPISTFGYGTTTLLPEETWIRISGGSGSLLITGGGGNLTIK